MSLAEKKSALFGGKPSAAVSVTPITSAPATSAASGAAPKTLSATSFLRKDDQGRAKRLEEARSLAAEGAARLKTSAFQWTPDHLAAASLLERAAEAYRAAGDMTNARLTLVACADSNEALGALGATAVLLQKAARLAHDEAAESSAEPSLVKEATRLYLRAADCWGTHGEVEKCADCFFKAAVEVEDLNLKKSMQFYARAVDLLLPSDCTSREQLARLHPVVLETCREYWLVLLRREMFEEAIVFAERCVPLHEAFESDSSLCKGLCAISVLQLSIGDVVRAHECFLEHLSSAAYRSSSECRLAEGLVMAFVRMDVEALDAAKASADVRYLDRQVAELVKRLSLFAAKNAVRRADLPLAKGDAGTGIGAGTGVEEAVGGGDTGSEQEQGQGQGQGHTEGQRYEEDDEIDLT